MGRVRWKPRIGVAGATVGTLVVFYLLGGHQGSRPLDRERLLSERHPGAIALPSSETLGRAATEWREAYREALRSRRWETLLEVGDRAAEIAAREASPEFRAEARRAYLAALFRARALRSAEGVRRVAEAFASLGDREVADQVRRVLVQP
jgi:hypothetical protein